MKASLSRLAAAALALVLSACAASTPATRIAKAPQLFEPLGAEQKKAVLEGRVTEGMTPDAVFLACGPPDRVVRGSAQGQPFENWSYTQLEPVYRTGLSVGFGSYYGPRYRHAYGGSYYNPNFLDFDSGPDYLPVTAATVRFRQNRVVAWERLR